MTRQGFVYVEDAEGRPKEIINHARTYEALRRSNIPGLSIDTLDGVLGCRALYRHPKFVVPADLSGLEVLRSMEGWWDPAELTEDGRGLRNLGTAGPALDARAGSTASADGNDPAGIDGEPGWFIPIVTGNGLRFPAPGSTWTNGIEVLTRQKWLDYTAASTGMSFSVAESAAARTFIGALSAAGAPIVIAMDNSGGTPLNTSIGGVLPWVDNTTYWQRWRLYHEGGFTKVAFHWAPDTGSNDVLPTDWTLGGSIQVSQYVIRQNADRVTVGCGYGAGATNSIDGKVMKFVLRNGVDGATLIDVDGRDITSGTGTTVTPRVGAVGDIITPAAGRKTVQVIRPVRLYGTDDYDEILADPLGAYVQNPATSGVGITAPDIAAMNIGAGPFQIDFDIEPTGAISAAGTKTICAQVGVAGDRAFQLYAATSALGFVWYADGTTAVATAACNFTVLGIPTTPGTRARGRLIWRGDNGSGNWDVRWYSVAADGTATLVETDTGVGTSTIFNSTANIELGARTGLATDFLPGRYRSVSFTVNGTIATEFKAWGLAAGESSYINEQGHTWSLSGAQVVNANPLNVGAADSATWTVAFRQKATPVSNGRYFDKYHNIAPARGWMVYNPGTTLNPTMYLHDGTDVGSGGNLSSVAAGAMSVVTFVLNRADLTLRTYINGVLTDTDSAAAIGSLSTAVATSIGRSWSGSFAQDFELFGASFDRRALAAAEVMDVAEYISTWPEPVDTEEEWYPATFLTASTGDTAPWYDGSDASAEAVGMWVEEWTGMDGSHNARSVTEVGPYPGGASLGRLSHQGRTMKVNVLTFATTERGSRHLVNWLDATLRDACGRGGVRTMWVREACASSEDNWNEGVAILNNVGLVEGPTFEAEPIETSRLIIRRLSFTLVAGDPCLYSPRRPVGVDSVYHSATAATADNPATIVARRGETLVAGTYATAWGVGHEAGSWASAAPIVTITSDLMLGTDGKRAHIPPLSIFVTSDSQFSVEREWSAGIISDPIADHPLISRLDLKAIPSGIELEINFATRSLRYRGPGFADRQWKDGWVYVADRGLHTSRWNLPPKSCRSVWVSARPTFMYRPDFTTVTADADGFTGPYLPATADGAWTVTYDVADRWSCL